jgi:hypothetical protein
MEDKTMNMTPVLIALVLAVGMIMGLYGYYNSINTVYVHDNSATLNQGNISAIKATNNKVNDLMNNISSKTTNIASKGILSVNGIVDSVLVFVDVAGLVTQAPGIIIGFIGQTLNIIPGIGSGGNWFIPMITAIIVIVFASLIASIVLKRYQSEI